MSRAWLSPRAVLREAGRGLLRHPLRSGLALLGLVIGISSVVGTISLLRAVQVQALASIARSGALDVIRIESPESV